MLDELLFQRGHIMVRIGDECDDFDNIIAEHYFSNIKGLNGKIVELEGSEYALVKIDNKDNFTIDFLVDGVEFKPNNGESIIVSQLEVQCTGTIIQEDFWKNGNPIDVLRLDTFDVIDDVE